MSSTLTAERRAELRRGHRPCCDPLAPNCGCLAQDCFVGWPCDTALLLDVLDTAERERDELAKTLKDERYRMNKALEAEEQRRIEAEEERDMHEGAVERMRAARQVAAP